jgi:hypothetical protein
MLGNLLRDKLTIRFPESTDSCIELFLLFQQHVHLLHLGLVLLGHRVEIYLTIVRSSCNLNASSNVAAQ